MSSTAWNAKMPRQKPDAGKAFVVVAIKMDDGRRVEYSGQVDADLATTLLHKVTRDRPDHTPQREG
ncbi:hypothetical protein [Primorskyibacter sedentarius]|uniref:hypothetical protein n=1 Tax=Primorskyibacter sedentarius TaxID=745311 RepID=UPI003EBB52EF